MLKKHKKIIIIASIIFLIIILLLITLVPNAKQSSLEQATYSSIQAIPSNEAAVALMKCKYIKQEKSSSPDYEIDIYLEFDKPLFTGDESNEVYFSQLTQIVAGANNYINFRLIDEAKQIVVAVICNNGEIERTIINGDSNYYGRIESYKSLQEFKRPKTTKLYVESELLQTLMDDDWDIRPQNLEYPEELENKYYYYPLDGVEVKTIKNKVFNIIFTDAYEGSVIDGFNANSQLEDVVALLGEPTFGSISENTIGYKSEELYAFFTEDAVSIYRIEDYDTLDFEQEVQNYQYTSNLKTYITNITDIWPDYDSYYYDQNTIDLHYTLKGIAIKYGITYNHGLTIYTNYKGRINSKEIEELTLQEIPNEVYFENKDSVAEYEMQRAQQNRLMKYIGDDEEQRVW